MKLKQFILSLLPRLSDVGRYRKVEAYRATIASISRYYGDKEEPTLGEFYKRRNIEEYLAYLSRRGISRNTQCFYLNNIRSAYSEAVAQGRLKEDLSIFYRLSISYMATEKRALSPNTLAKIALADLSDDPHLENSRDYFVLSLFLQGMGFMDMAYLRTGDFRDGKIRYRRRKTNSFVEVTVIQPAVSTLKRLMVKAKNTPYLLPILCNHEGKRAYLTYQAAIHRQNINLKKIGERLELQETLTTYSTRHSWATMAYMNGIDLGVVSQGMGHRTEGTTRTYLASFSDNRLQEANLVVWLSILNKLENIRNQSEDEAILAEVKTQINQISRFLERIETEKEQDGLGIILQAMKMKGFK